MIGLLTSSILISGLHGLLPNHWLPLLAISKAKEWSFQKLMHVTFIAALAHALSTVLLGIVISIIGAHLSHTYHSLFHIVSPLIIISLGIFFIFQHYLHHHFHLKRKKKIEKAKTDTQIIIAITIAMFFSPCIEIEALYLSAGGQGSMAVIAISCIYLFISIIGIMLWVFVGHKGIERFNWHSIEHNAGIITGVTLILTGISFFYLH